MDHGLHVFIEKPLCLKAAEGEVLIATAGHRIESHGRTVTAFRTEYCWRSDRYVAVICRLLSASCRTGSAPYGRNGTWILIAPEPRPDLHIHDIDFVRFMLGEPKKSIREAIIIPSRRQRPVHHSTVP